MLLFGCEKQGRKQLGGRPARVFVFLFAVQRKMSWSAAPHSRGLAFPDCLLPINQPLTLDASRIFERDSGSFVTEASVVFNLLSSRH